ncbi:MAG: hypothetical protein Q7T26_04280 [Dehalococcoidia bacterium]|nr:hypothetical protein [Dehalococcoidia bacterium]
MKFGIRFKKSAVFGLLGTILMLASACSGISQADLDAAKAQATAQEKKAADLQKQLAAKDQEIQAAQQKAAAAAKQAGSMALVSAALAKPRTPAPTPVPGAPTPRPPPPPPPSLYEPVPFVVYVEVLTSSHGNLKINAEDVIQGSIACVGATVFKRGMNIVWRFEVFDTSTGKRLTPQDGSTVKLRMQNGDEKTVRFGQRAGGRQPDAPFMWVTQWDVPLNYPLGALTYEFDIATKDGRKYTWKPPYLIFPQGSPPEDTRLQIIE